MVAMPPGVVVKDKHIQIRIEQCLALAKASSCPRRKFGALLLDPKRNVVLMDGYNGGPRGGGKLCGGHKCIRTEKSIESGTRVEIGCHHAEMNVICNAAANGVKTNGAWLIVTGSCCPMCAKLIHHAGISKVIVVSGKYSTEKGMIYLKQHGVEIEYRNESKKGNVLKTINHFVSSGSKEFLCGNPKRKRYSNVIIKKAQGMFKKIFLKIKP